MNLAAALDSPPPRGGVYGDSMVKEWIGVVFFLGAALPAQSTPCGCSVGTVPIDPQLSVAGCVVFGTIQDVGSVPGQCQNTQCPDKAKPCTHNVWCHLTLSGPVTNPPPSLTVEISFPPARSAFVLPPSTITTFPPVPPNTPAWMVIEWVYPLTLEADCGKNGAVQLLWQIPGGSYPQSSGSIAMTCGNC